MIRTPAIDKTLPEIDESDFFEDKRGDFQKSVKELVAEFEQRTGEKVVFAEFHITRGVYALFESDGNSIPF